MNYLTFFETATGQKPYDYQLGLAYDETWPSLLEAPTGAGKTEAIVLAWLWRRRHAQNNTNQKLPRRLAYCLPMRVLVEQTRDRVQRWLNALGLAEQVGVHILMGGENAEDWDLYPEREAILIGTQDMLLSRALNRGYAVSRARWPMPYALLNNDCLWVFDEVQLMGSGLATTAQLAAFRAKFKTLGNCSSMWVSATLRPDWLATVDFQDTIRTLHTHQLSDHEWDQLPLSLRLNATKTLQLAKTRFSIEKSEKKPNVSVNTEDQAPSQDDSSADNADEKEERVGKTDKKQKLDPNKKAIELAVEIWDAHRANTLTLVVVNTVDRAIELYKALQAKCVPDPKRGKALLVTSPLDALQPQIMLLHSRFRPPDRRKKIAQLLRMQDEGGIVISTQVIEAGVDISARVMFTELAPWASLVQRVGRCNRKGEYEKADVFWVDLDEDRALPYAVEELTAARTQLLQMQNMGPRALRDHLAGLAENERAALYPAPAGSVIRKKDVLELFNTTTDLTGSDLDISSYVRDVDEITAQVIWREFDRNPNDPLQAAAQRDELCAVPIGKLNDFLKKKKTAAYRWDFLEGQWARAEKIVPGQVYLLQAQQGGYDSDLGWNADSAAVEVISDGLNAADANKNDLLSHAKVWQTLANHTNDVVYELDGILTQLAQLLLAEDQSMLRQSARWHDWGKAHYVFQNAFDKANPPPPQILGVNEAWAKSSGKAARYEHSGFRHELASALAMLQHGHSALACYVVAAHHGKVRVSIRAMPSETPAPQGKRFARGVWDDDVMPAVNLGGGVLAPEVTLSLAPMELGLSIEGQPSWAERVLELLEIYGPFRLAYLEALLCAADRRASAKAGSEL